MLPHRDRLRELLKLTIASAAEDAGADPDTWCVHDLHALAANLFIELANQIGQERDMVSSAMLAAAARYAVFNATRAYTEPMNEAHIRAIKRQIEERMREANTSSRIAPPS